MLFVLLVDDVPNRIDPFLPLVRPFTNDRLPGGAILAGESVRVACIRRRGIGIHGVLVSFHASLAIQPKLW